MSSNTVTPNISSAIQAIIQAIQGALTSNSFDIATIEEISLELLQIAASFEGLNQSQQILAVVTGVKTVVGGLTSVPPSVKEFVTEEGFQEFLTMVYPPVVSGFAKLCACGTPSTGRTTSQSAAQAIHQKVATRDGLLKARRKVVA